MNNTVKAFEPKKMVLIVEDETSIAENIYRLVVNRMDLDAMHVDSMQAAIEQCAKHFPECIILDLNLVDGQSINRLDELHLVYKDKSFRPQVTLTTTDGNIETSACFNLFKEGKISDYITKPYSLEQIEKQIISSLQKQEKDQITEYKTIQAKTLQKSKSRGRTFIGNSESTKKIKKEIQNFAQRLKQFPAEDRPTILILGETGTGKDVVANYFNEQMNNTDALMLADCTTLTDQLFQSQLYGHVKNAFTGAAKDHIGMAEAVNEGVLFFDELGELSLANQAGLLTFIQSRQFTPLGSNKSKKFKGTLVFATNRDLKQMSADGTFRDDLYFRVSTLTIELLPLRERKDDILPIATHFLKENLKHMGHPDIGFSQAAVDKLLAYDWPGNIRQLNKVIQLSVLKNVMLTDEPFTSIPAEAIEIVDRGMYKTPGTQTATATASKPQPYTIPASEPQPIVPPIEKITPSNGSSKKNL